MSDQRLAMEAPGAGNGSINAQSSDDDRLPPWEYILREHLLLLATVAATVTYSAGFSPPGGVWDETGPVAGDPIIRHTSYYRFVAFFYPNAAAFASSLVVIVLILILSLRHDLKRGNLGPMSVLRGFMVLDLLSIMGAYTAGIYWNRKEVPVYTMVLAALTIVYVVVSPMVKKKKKKDGDDANGEPVRKKVEETRKVLMLLATFAVSVTYAAGLSAPGGFRDDDKGGHRPGDPALLGGGYGLRLKAFINLNSTAFFWSLLITVQLLDKNLHMARTTPNRFRLLYTSIVLVLLGLVGAYATGSSRDADTTSYVVLLCGAIAAFTILLGMILRCRHSDGEQAEANHSSGGQAVDKANGRWRFLVIALKFASDDRKAEQEKARSLVLLLATLAATITYQAGLDPPGGVWDNDGKGYMAGDPILLTTNPRRYKVFFYSNSVAFVASLVAIILVNQKILLQTHALEAAMILDLFGLIGAYAAGSCRDVSTSIYAMALAGAVLVYVVIHVLFFTLDHDTSGSDEVVETRRERLLLFAILAATITYQAGLTPPGGFWLQDDEVVGRHAGEPILHSISRSRYNGFFYCNSVSFMLSIAMILLLVNKNLYRPAIRSHAIAVCTAAGMFSLVGAYAAGSTQHLRTSIKIFGLAAAILIALVAVVLLFGTRRSAGIADVENKVATTHVSSGARVSKREHMMLLGILAASVTYQAGLKPPGGVWQDDDAGLGHVAGNPIMRDNGKTRYHAFFYINATSFVASVVVIVLLLLKPLLKKLYQKWSKKWSPRAMSATIVLDLLGLLVAYAVGSSRSWKDTGYVVALVFSVLAYIAIHVTIAWLIHMKRNGSERGPKVGSTPDSLPNQEEISDATGP